MAYTIEMFADDVITHEYGPATPAPSVAAHGPSFGWDLFGRRRQFGQGGYGGGGYGRPNFFQRGGYGGRPMPPMGGGMPMPPAPPMGVAPPAPPYVAPPAPPYVAPPAPPFGFERGHGMGFRPGGFHPDGFHPAGFYPGMQQYECVMAPWECDPSSQMGCDYGQDPLLDPTTGQMLDMGSGPTGSQGTSGAGSTAHGDLSAARGVRSMRM